jgi:hypothetical protein
MREFAVVSSLASEVTSVTAKDDADNICRDVILDAICTKQRLPGGTPKRDANRGLSAFQRFAADEGTRHTIPIYVVGARGQQR